MVDLPKVLEAKNKNGKFDAIIKRAKAGGYHDFKFIETPEYNDCICPKIQLVSDLSIDPSLSGLRAAVIRGEYDDIPDEADKDIMRKELDDGPEGEAIKKLLGL